MLRLIFLSSRGDNVKAARCVTHRCMPLRSVPFRCTVPETRCADSSPLAVKTSSFSSSISLLRVHFVSVCGRQVFPFLPISILTFQRIKGLRTAPYPSPQPPTGTRQQSPVIQRVKSEPHWPGLEVCLLNRVSEP